VNVELVEIGMVEGASDGNTVGGTDGVPVGEILVVVDMVGDTEGAFVLAVGAELCVDGAAVLEVGIAVGSLGDAVGLNVGDIVGIEVGDLVGESVVARTEVDGGAVIVVPPTEEHTPRHWQSGARQSKVEALEPVPPQDFKL